MTNFQPMLDQVSYSDYLFSHIKAITEII